jgi:hypothetical protein
MTVTTAPLSADTMSRAIRPKRLRSYFLFTLVACLYLLPFMRLVFIGDEGSLVEGAVRILHGQVFARDFFEVIGPGTFYILAGFFKLLGATMVARETWLFASSLGTVLSMYFLSRRVCGTYQWLPPELLIGIYFATVWPMVSHHVDSNLFALLSVACIVVWQDMPRNVLLIAAGIGSGLTTWILQPKGVLLLLAFVVWFVIQHRRRSAPLSALGVILASYSALIGVVLLYFWSQGALRDLIYINFVWPSQHYEAVNVIPYARGMFQFWDQWVMPIHGVRWLVPLAIVLITPFLLVAALPMLLPVLGIARGKHNLQPEILLYWLCGGSLWLSEFHRRDLAHLCVGSPLLIILFVYFVGQYRGKIAELTLRLLTISACALAIINVFIVLSAHSVSTRVGKITMFDYDPAIKFLDAKVAPGTEIFIYPNAAMYYYLSGTTNPTPYSILMYNYNTPSQFQEVMHLLEQRRVRYVLWNLNFERKASPYFSAAMNKPAGGFVMEPYLASHYRVVMDEQGLRMLERREDVDVK